MIKSFYDIETEKIWKGSFSKKFPISIQSVARRKLRMLNNMKTLQDLRVPPANRLEALKEDMLGTYSIRINDQWRVCFVWNNEQPYDVRIINYH